jgi:predicted nucleotide-binding protein (sugar kinase/HSP70/actin superfamily)
MVGEIFLRMHRGSNQDLIRTLERYGAEVVNASMGEWLNYVSYDGLRQAKKKLRLGLRLLRPRQVGESIREALGFGVNLLFQERTQQAVFRRARRRLDIAADHRIGHLEKILNASGDFSFDIPTEACLSIPGILHCARNGYNGVVNVYPFTCMPGMTTSAVVRPILHELGLPFLDTPCDDSLQPNRETAIRTFLYQARQHWQRHGRKM